MSKLEMDILEKQWNVVFKLELEKPKVIITPF